MKNRKKQRAYRSTDSIHAAVEAAAKKEDMSVNEWTLYAIRACLKQGVLGSEPVNLEEVGALAKANAMDRLTAAIEKSTRVFDETRKDFE
jgi:hypothetical protein